ncbi:putative rust resistance kinase Lr10 [Hordeum vulgare]|nr:putative rust resistance kinase Lr10 [Hordeum vulgare]
MNITHPITVLLLCLLSHATDMATASAWDDKDFFRHCPSSRCSKNGPEIRFPLRLESSNSSSSCRATCAKVTCSGQDTILLHPLLGPCKVTTIDYSRAVFTIVPLVDSCPLQKLISINLPATADVDRCGLYEFTPAKLVYCSSVFTPSGTAEFAGSHAKVIAATSSVATFIVLSVMVATTIYLSVKSRYNEEINMKVEMFLKAYGTSKPTRYTFSDVKKIARRFKDKLGQGGFGSVYKGELPNGVPVAVKMLESSTGEGEDFINEVATIGLIHHANIVRLLGFCSEGMRRALIYEFMPNESLEKYIFPQVPNISRQLLAPNKMLDIALGIARGMEYLHQGCNQRILHFDIKPHNILLDYNFNPKISDFGLAKLCARDQSIITLTAARGTMGYIAPEVYSRNFGGVSYKSDVYSFGMLVLEMVSGRRNSDPSVEYQDEVYLPEWVYERVISGHEWELTSEMTAEEKEKMRQLTIVALWCIQWNPKNRPSMTKVLEMQWFVAYLVVMLR